MTAKALEFSAEEVAVLRRLVDREIEREQEEKRDAERRVAAAAAFAAERAETERMKREGQLIFGRVWHNAYDFQCRCAECAKKHPISIEGAIGGGSR